MKAELKAAFGYQGDAMNLPVADVEPAVGFYTDVLGFRVVSRGDTPERSVVLARDEVRIRLAENGGDPTQDGCAFHVTDAEALCDDFMSHGLGGARPAFEVERHDDQSFKVFYVVAPDGLCYWFGERQSS